MIMSKSGIVFMAMSAGLCLAMSLSGCTSSSQSNPSSALSGNVASSTGTSGDELPGNSIEDDNQDNESPDTPEYDPADYPPEDGMALPDVDPEPESTFCQEYITYANAGGPYTLQEAGDQLPSFTQTDLDEYARLQSAAPADIKPTLDTMLRYGQEMNKGDFSHGVDYENLLNGPNGLVLYAISYCQLDMESI